jgi:hypothetical protein
MLLASSVCGPLRGCRSHSRARSRFEAPTQSAFHFRGVTLYPPPDGDMIGVQAPISEQVLDVTVRKREAQIPGDGRENHLRFKLAPLEKTTNRRCQEEHPASVPCGDCKVATLPQGKPFAGSLFAFGAGIGGLPEMHFNFRAKGEPSLALRTKIRALPSKGRENRDNDHFTPALSGELASCLSASCGRVPSPSPQVVPSPTRGPDVLTSERD